MGFAVCLVRRRGRLALERHAANGAVSGVGFVYVGVHRARPLTLRDGLPGLGALRKRLLRDDHSERCRGRRTRRAVPDANVMTNCGRRMTPYSLPGLNGGLNRGLGGEVCADGCFERRPRHVGLT